MYQGQLDKHTQSLGFVKMENNLSIVIGGPRSKGHIAGQITTVLPKPALVGTLLLQISTAEFEGYISSAPWSSPSPQEGNIKLSFQGVNFTGS